MRICEIHIEEFGGITDKHVFLDRGFNLLCGENESGKSTLCNFIKYIFYGFSGAAERSERVSFKTGVSSGYIVIEDVHGEKYRIVRYDSERSKGRISVFKEPSGIEFTLWKEQAATPGDYFFGVTEKLYSRSVYVSQVSGAALDGGSAEAVSNLLISGDEATNLAKAKKALDAYRKSLKLKKGRGGRIADTEDKLIDLKDAFDRAARLKDEIADVSASIRELNEEKKNETERLEAIKQRLSNAKSQKIRELLKADKEYTDALNGLEGKKKDLMSKYTVNGFLPDEVYVRDVSAAKKTADATLERHERLKEKITAITEKKMLTVPQGYEEYIEMGGPDSAKEKYRRQNTLKRRHELFAIFCTILSITSIVSFFIPESFGVQLERSITFTATSTVLALVFGALFIYYAYKVYKLNKRLFISSKRPQTKAFEEFDAYDKANGNDFRSLSDTLTESESAAEETEKALNDLLGRWGKSSADEVESEYLRYVDCSREINAEFADIQSKKNYNSALLSVYTDSELETALRAPAEDIDATAEGYSEKNVTELEIRLENIKGTLHALQLRRAEISGGESPDLTALTAEIDETEASLSQLKFSFLATELAMEALEKAENNIRYTVSPYLSEIAGGYFASLTENRYSGLLLDEKMSLRYRDGETGTPIDSVYLSGGSTDLAWICLRLALHKKLSESRPIPLILDECFVYFDDTRLKAILKRLTDMAKESQVILFSASSRERDILKGSINTVNI